jgi:hypothetical protein
MKIFLLTEEFDRTVDVMGCYDSLEKAQDAAVSIEKAQGATTGALEWRPPALGERNASNGMPLHDVQNPIDNIVSVAIRSSGGDLFVVRGFLLNRLRLGPGLAPARQLD